MLTAKHPVTFIDIVGNISIQNQDPTKDPAGSSDFGSGWIRIQTGSSDFGSGQIRIHKIYRISGRIRIRIWIRCIPINVFLKSQSYPIYNRFCLSVLNCNNFHFGIDRYDQNLVTEWIVTVSSILGFEIQIQEFFSFTLVDLAVVFVIRATVKILID